MRHRAFSNLVQSLRRDNPVMTGITGIVIGVLAATLATSGSNRPIPSHAIGATGSAQTGDGAIGASSPLSTVQTATSGAATAASGSVVGGSGSPGSIGQSGGHGPVSTFATGCSGSALDGVQGVTATTVKVGIGLADLGGLQYLGPQLNIGNQQAHWQEILASLQKRKALPVCGRTIIPVYRTYNILDTSSAQAACVGWAQDDHVFAVIAEFAFSAANCITQENGMYFLELGSGETDSQYSDGRLFTMEPSFEEQMTDWATWAVRTRLLDGKKIGVYYNTNNNGAAVQSALIGTLQRLGHPPTVVVTSSTNGGTASSQGDPNDPVAIAKFKAAGVDVVFPLQLSNDFYQQAQSQNYHPQWLAEGPNASDAITASYPAATYDGALGIQWEHTGEAAGGYPLNPAEAQCISDWVAAGNPRPHQEWGEWNTITESCDLANIFVAALKNAGRGLNTSSLVQGNQVISDLQTGFDAPQTFGATKHYGVSENWQEQYFASCTCWKRTGQPESLYAS